MTKDNFMSNIYGYSEIKDELYRIKGWLENKSFTNNPKINLVNGILFYGAKGLGKTMMMKEFMASFDCPKYIIEGNMDNVCEEIADVFDQAQKNDFSIILIDEIDTLVENDPKLERILLSSLDGINKERNILVLATASVRTELNHPLFRQGRFSRIFRVSHPDYDTIAEMVKKYLLVLDVDDCNINYDEIAKIFDGVSCADISAIVNDCYLRVLNNFSTEELEKSYDRIVNNTYVDKPIKKSKQISVHEAAHCLLSFLSENWSFYSARFTENGGVTELIQKEESQDTIQKREEKIRISMAGYLGEKLIFGKKDVGSFRDYEDIYDQCTRLIERVCIKGIWNVIPSYRTNDTRYDTVYKRRKNEKLVIKLMHKYERQTYKILKKNKDKLLYISDVLYDNGHVYYKDIENKLAMC